MNRSTLCLFACVLLAGAAAAAPSPATGHAPDLTPDLAPPFTPAPDAESAIPAADIEAAHAFHAAADRNGDGLLSLEELIDATGHARSCRPRAMSARQALGEMADGMRERLETDFARADLNGDGFLGAAEFAVASYEPAAAARGRASR